VSITWLSEQTRSGIQARVKQLNASLAQAFTHLDQSYPDLRLVSPDAFGLFSAFIDSSAEFGMTVSYPAAMQDDGLSNRSFTGPGADYVFWDQYGHPTAKGHAMIAQRFLQTLTNAVPERLALATSGSTATLTMGKLLIGRNYVVEASDDLKHWSGAYPFTATSGTNEWNGIITNSAQYYRLAWQP
jgi:phospholipase/lecithinase/hemolysin